MLIGKTNFTTTYSPATLKLNKKYLKFFWVFPQIIRVMRSLSIKNNCRNASKMKKLQFFKFWAFFGYFSKILIFGKF